MNKLGGDLKVPSGSGVSFEENISFVRGSKEEGGFESQSRINLPDLAYVELR